MIQHVIIENYEERYAPPEGPVLRVALVGDVAFLDIGELEDRTFDSTFTSSAERQIAVPATSLVNSITLLAKAQNRDDLDKVHDGRLRIDV